jgi:hypothetical protein
MHRLALVVWGAALVAACHSILPLENRVEQTDAAPTPDVTQVDHALASDGPLDGSNGCDGSVDLATDPDNCGTCGNACPPAKDPCRRPACVDGKCTTADRPEGEACWFNGKAGLCHHKKCCTGCWDGSKLECRAGTTGDHCGAQGGPCVVCKGVSPCGSDSCTVKGECLAAAKPDGTICTELSEPGSCRAGKCCTGCWDPLKNACQPGTDPEICGDKGVVCLNCVASPSDGCTSYGCSPAVGCTIAVKVDGTPCPGGKCWKGKCCLGCWDGLNCLPGKDIAWCGIGGESCMPCPSTSSCTLPYCSTGACKQSPKPDGALCPGGTCVGGACCTGCVDKVTGKCVKGDQPSACGTGGGACGVCIANNNPCQKTVCMADGACGFANVADGTTCPTGLPSTGACWNGDCCDGCWNGTACVTSSTSASDDVSCGSNGALCTSCDTCGQSCVSGGCKLSADQPDGDSCTDESGKSGTCVQGDCCTGCVDQVGSSNSCLPGTSDTKCGVGGEQCKSCVLGATCKFQECK